MIAKTFQEVLDEIIHKDIDSLTGQEILFLKSRQSYLNETYKTKFRSILEPKVETKKGTHAKK